MAGEIDIKVEGLESLKQKLKDAGSKAPRRMEAQLMREAGRVMNRAQQLVPVITGRLRSSAFIRQVKRNQHRTDVVFGYEAPYSAAVHERPQGRGYHWLRRAFEQVQRGAEQRLLSAVITVFVGWGR